MSGAYTVLANGRVVHYHAGLLDECDDVDCTKPRATRAQLDDFADEVAAYEFERGVAAGKGEL